MSNCGLQAKFGSLYLSLNANAKTTARAAGLLLFIIQQKSQNSRKPAEFQIKNSLISSYFFWPLIWILTIYTNKVTTVNWWSNTVIILNKYSRAVTMAHQNLSHVGGLTHSVIKGVHEEPSGAQDALGTRRLRPLAALLATHHWSLPRAGEKSLPAALAHCPPSVLPELGILFFRTTRIIGIKNQQDFSVLAGLGSQQHSALQTASEAQDVMHLLVLSGDSNF